MPPLPRRRGQDIARKPRLDIRDVAVNLAEPVSGAGRDDDHVSRMDFVRLSSLDARGPFAGIGHGSARRVPTTAFEDVVHLRHVLTITFLRVDARIVWPVDSAANNERWHDAGGLASH